MKVQVQVFDRFETLEVHEREWRALLQENPTRSVFQQRAWMETWWKHLGQDCYLRFMVARDPDNRLLGLAPLMLDRHGSMRFIADSNSDYLDFIIPHERETVLDAFMAELARRRSEWRSIRLINLRRCSTTLELVLKLARRHGLYPHHRNVLPAPSLIIRGNEDHVHKLLNKYSLRRAEKKLARKGSIRFRVLDRESASDTLWETYFAQHRRRSHCAGRKSSFDNPAYCTFVREFFEQANAQGCMEFSLLELDGRPVAFHLGFICEERLLWYKPSFDLDLQMLSPGTVLIRYLIRHAVELGCQELDFTIGAEDFKNRFATLHRRTDSVHIHASRLRHIAGWIGHSVWKRLKPVVQRLRLQLPRPTCPARPRRKH
ncbi:MAG TPA: GNAT family N-acetyltransferase [Gammaproteobacteria bacterium]|nr:GNAT family N-acetyltransferase [Gammaproteobacteria bacterium]